jgi:hypothetical protein
MEGGGGILASWSKGQEVKRMDSPTPYFHWGFILISLPNLLVIAGMVALFAVALIAPFPHGGKDDGRN